MTTSIAPNIGIIPLYGDGVIGPNTTAMGSLLGAWAGLFASSVAKVTTVTSTALV
jgi:hypothetical protein